jgi:hypothetical protein
MAYASWPVGLPDPESPFSEAIGLPLKMGKVNEIGAYKTSRRYTRAKIAGSSKLILTQEQVTTFRTFYRTTLNDGNSLFTADWIAVLGYDGYVGKLVKFSFSPKGAIINASLQITLIPSYREDAGSGLSSPWPRRDC